MHVFQKPWGKQENKFFQDHKTAVSDQPFHNFRASKSVDQRFQTTQSSSIDGFWSFKMVNKSVGKDGD